MWFPAGSELPGEPGPLAITACPAAGLSMSLPVCRYPWVLDGPGQGMGSLQMGFKQSRRAGQPCQCLSPLTAGWTHPLLLFTHPATPPSMARVLGDEPRPRSKVFLLQCPLGGSSHLSL